MGSLRCRSSAVTISATLGRLVRMLASCRAVRAGRTSCFSFYRYRTLVANLELARAHEFPNGVDGLLYRDQITLRITDSEFGFLRASGLDVRALEREGKAEVESAGLVLNDLVGD